MCILVFYLIQRLILPGANLAALEAQPVDYAAGPSTCAAALQTDAGTALVFLCSVICYELEEFQNVSRIATVIA